METYLELKKRHEQEVHALPLGFAFDNKRLEQMKIQLGVKEDDELYRLSNFGGYCRKVDFEMIEGVFSRHAEERHRALFSTTGYKADYVQSMFYYEMRNHEFAINWSGKADVLAACDITEEQLNTIPELQQAWEAAKRQYYADVEKNGWC